MKNILFLLITVLAVVARASSEGGGHEENHIPTQWIAMQAINLGILLVAIYFLTRKGIAEAFVNRRSEFIAKSEKTKLALKQAEAELSDIKSRLNQLESSETASLEKAKHEATITAAHMVAEAEHQASKIKTDADMTINNDMIRAREEVNALILKNAVQAASQKMSTAAPAAMKSMENTFLASVDGAQSKAGV